MDFIWLNFLTSIEKVWHTLGNNWPYLLVGVLISVLMQRYLNVEKATAFLQRYRSAGVLAATAAAVGTPLCSCGTTAVVLGMMANAMPWAPIVAFMVSSPLTSPQELIYSAGLFGWPFALAFFAASIVLGLLGGAVAALLEDRGWLANQTRLTLAPAAPRPVENAASVCCAVTGPVVQPAAAACCTAAAPAVSAAPERVTICACQDEPAAGVETGTSNLLLEALRSGARLLAMFVGFAFVGYFLNGLIPAAWVAALFGPGAVYSVPLAATLGLPLYINSEASLPLVKTLIEAGMSPGSALAFLIAGSGTSMGAVAGALTIARWRVIAVVVGTLWLGAILAGLAYNLWWFA